LRQTKQSAGAAAAASVDTDLYLMLNLP
jgi:hypothetical protein